MEEKKTKRKLKPININRKSIPKLTGYDLLLKSLPPTEIKLVNSMGQLLIDEVNIKLTSSEHWRNLRFFYEKLLPRVIPPDIQTFTNIKRKKDVGYVG